MKMFATVTAATIALAGASFAQTTTQAGALGASGDPVYELQVQGANGIIYNCKPEPVVVDGNTARVCVRADDANLFAVGSGIGSGAGVPIDQERLEKLGDLVADYLSAEGSGKETD